MAKDKPTGCVEAAEGPIMPDIEMKKDAPAAAQQSGGAKMQVMVGKEAPDFGATAFVKGAFTSVKLSDYRGKWVFLCFYPGDFTFV